MSSQGPRLILLGRPSAVLVALWAGMALACGEPPRASVPVSTPTPMSLVAARPFGLEVPAGYTAASASPLVALLHGYGADGARQAQYFGLLPDADEHGYLLAHPDGTVDSRGNRFWNATDGCCNFEGRPVDDVAYLAAVIDDVKVLYNVDPKRVYVIGHSNGGFMAHRLACEISDRIAAVVSLAGALWKDPERCRPAERINVLQVHGDADDTIRYTGAFNYPSAAETVAIWAQKNGCAGGPTVVGADKDIDVGLAGAETSTGSYAGCPPGGDVELWTIRDGAHVPALGPAWADEVWSYFLVHPKP